MRRFKMPGGWRRRPDLDRFGDRAVIEAQAKVGIGVVPTFLQLVTAAWDYLDKDLQLAGKLGIDSRAFREALVEHVGVSDALD